MVDAVTALNQNPVESKAASAASGLAGDLDSFLLLLTTQLQNQDPLSPLEPTEFTGQLVQFASVEQQIAANSTMEALLAVQNSSLAASVVGFIGTDVEANGSTLPLQNGEASFTYTLANNAKANVITILDSEGRVILTRAGETDAGSHEFLWDGKGTDGNQAADGAYKLNITPVDFEDEAISKTVVIKARITGVNMKTGETTLEAGGVIIPLKDVLAIKEARSTSTTTE
ncbi:MAG: flagellar hook assembly protein FlgD [Rhodospirillales bacterium]|jgi:flagellar basal-body rod modification protein FlgD